MHKISKSWEFMDAFVVDILTANGFKITSTNPFISADHWKCIIYDSCGSVIAKIQGTHSAIYISTKGFWGQHYFDTVDLCTIDDATGEDFGDWQNPEFDPSYWVDRILRLILRRRKWRKLRIELGLEG